jgi:hypothetical protein
VECMSCEWEGRVELILRGECGVHVECMSCEWEGRVELILIGILIGEC